MATQIWIDHAVDDKQRLIECVGLLRSCVDILMKNLDLDTPTWAAIMDRQAVGRSCEAVVRSSLFTAISVLKLHDSGIALLLLAVRPFHLGNADFEVLVPAFFPLFLGNSVFGLLLPGSDA
ncbi:hypothetical protein LPB072_16680 [Hydrogenophaga crassostreae]|uniref:Uncharacterized protein n=1 Tax=Hydrogenophaga crassostreae TaxID=1763535 RepID=A0A1D8NYN7_9BURK|nr:hypothetical protein LPB072_16680 [Hydrogenophaga crassostreae]